MGKKNDIGEYINNKLWQLKKNDEIGNVSAQLAFLRKGIGHIPGELPEIYGLFLQDMPEDFWNDNGTITKEEWSCYIALTLYALHQQGNKISLHNMHTDERISIARGMKILAVAMGDSNAEERMQKKLQALISSKDMREFSYHCKNIIQLLKSKNITINYVDFAKDIYDFQYQESKNRISLKWGQDFYRKIKEKKDNE